MANHSDGFIEISGPREGLESMMERLHADRSGNGTFGGVYPMEEKDEISQNISREGKEFCVALAVRFHESIYESFLTDAWWDDFGRYFGTLSDACRQDQVCISAGARDYLTGYCEDLTCNQQGEITYMSYTCEIAECRACGEQVPVHPDVDMGQLTCPKCGHHGLRHWRDTDYDDDLHADCFESSRSLDDDLMPIDSIGDEDDEGLPF